MDKRTTEPNDMRQMTGKGRVIENNSFAIIDQEVGTPKHLPEEWEIVRRVIHATADFEFNDLMKLHPEAVNSGIAALSNGCPIYCDVEMIIAGLNKTRLASVGCQTYSFISDEDVITTAKKNNSTRAIESVKKAASIGLLDGAVIAVGNAPTALLEVRRLIDQGKIKPALIIGVPVGFVSAAESKEEILNQEVTPYIVSKGRKGGSTIAVSIIHALLLLGAKRELQ